MFARCLLTLFLLLFCLRCEATPSVGFRCDSLGENAEQFLKNHPRAYVYNPGVGYADSFRPVRSRREEMAQSNCVLCDKVERSAFVQGAYFFEKGKLARIQVFIDPKRYKGYAEDAGVLREPLKELLFRFGAPSFYSVTQARGEHKRRDLLLAWTRPTQSILAFVSWACREGEETRLQLVLTNNTFEDVVTESLLNGHFTVPLESPEDDTRRLYLFALMEELQPGSTRSVRLLNPKRLFTRKEQE